MKILVCLRTISRESPTLQMGKLLAELADSDIVLMTVLEDEEDIQQAEDALEEAAAEIRASGAIGPVTAKVTKGDPTKQILAETGAEKYGMLVLGAHEMSGFWDLLMASVMMKITYRARVPVLVVRGELSSIDRILICVGSSRPRRRTVRAARRVAEVTGASATVLYVADPVPSMYTGLDQMDESLSDLLRTETPIGEHLRWSADYLARHGVQADVEMRRGTATHEILAEAEQGAYDIIVAGASPSTGVLRRALLWPLTRSLLENAPCPVLIVH